MPPQKTRDFRPIIANPGRAPLWLALVAAAATLFVFWPALRNGFVMWDDDTNFLYNFAYRGLGPANLKWMWTTFHQGHYIPLTWMTLGLDHAVWGMNPYGYHLTNVLLHTANAGLFSLLAWRLVPPLAGEAGEGRARLPVLLAALLFALHPLRAESVAWVTERRDVLAGFFVLSSMLAYARWTETRARAAYALSLGLFAGALLSKATSATLPALLLLFDALPLRRWDGTGRGALPLIKEKVPFFGLSAAASIVMVLATKHIEALQAPFTLDALPARLNRVFFGAVFYLQKAVWPADLSPVYEPMSLGASFLDTRFAGYFAAFAAITVLALLWRRSRPLLLWTWLFHLAALSPFLGIADALSLAWDRYTYWPALGWSLAAGALLMRAAGRWPQRSPVLRVGGAAVLVLLGAATRRQIDVWRNSETLWTRAAEADPTGCYLAYANLGVLRMDEGRTREAEAFFGRALEVFPRHAKTLVNLGNLRMGEGRFAEAADFFARALETGSADARALGGLAAAWSRLGDGAKAVDYAERAARARPHPDALNNAGVVLLEAGRAAEAADLFERALDLLPTHPVAGKNLEIAREKGKAKKSS